MFQQYGDRAAFLFSCITEAHPDDEWQLGVNRRDSVVFEQPTTLKKRREAAQGCSKALRLSMPCVVDDMENSVDNAYAGWHERLFVVDTQGRIAYAGKQGPFGFNPAEVQKWLRRNLGRPH